MIFLDVHMHSEEEEDNYLSKKTAAVVDKDVVTVEESTLVADAAKLMRDNEVLSVLVSKDSKPVGIVTEKDIVYRVVAKSIEPSKATVKEIMSHPLVTISESASVRDAIVLMRSKGIRRMPVTKSDGEIVGMLTLRSIIGNSSHDVVPLAEVETPIETSKVMCPYCQSKFEDKQELSKHIDRLHLGSGLLEGDVRQWQ